MVILGEPVAQLFCGKGRQISTPAHQTQCSDAASRRGCVESVVEPCKMLLFARALRNLRPLPPSNSGESRVNPHPTHPKSPLGTQTLADITRLRPGCVPMPRSAAFCQEAMQNYSEIEAFCARNTIRNQQVLGSSPSAGSRNLLYFSLVWASRYVVRPSDPQSDSPNQLWEREPRENAILTCSSGTFSRFVEGIS